MYLLLDSFNLFTTEEVWCDVKLRDVFLTNLNELLKGIKSSNDVNILWSDRLDEYLWLSDKQPWKSQKSSFIPIFISINSILTKYKLLVEDHPTHPYSISPVFVSDDEHIVSDLAHSAVEQYKDIGVLSSSDEIAEYTLCCGNYTSKSLPVCKKVSDLYYLSPYWDSLTEQQFLELINSELYNIEVTNSFLKDIRCISKVTARKRFIAQVNRRVGMPQTEAVADNSIKDERIANGSRRFRVTKSDRVGYTADKNTLRFIYYTPSSKHDKYI